MRDEIYPDRHLAYQRFVPLLHRYFPIIKAVRKHNDLHLLVTCHNLDFYVVFKKDFFYTFNNQFPEFIFNNPDMGGVAETLNLDVLESVANREKETWIIFIYHNIECSKKAKKYVVNAKLFYNYAIKNSLIRVQEAINIEKRGDYSGQKDVVNEKTAHLPFKPCFFRNFEDWVEENMFIYSKI